MPLCSYSDKFQLSAVVHASSVHTDSLSCHRCRYITVVHASLLMQRQVSAALRSDSKGATGAIHHGGSCLSVHTATSSSCSAFRQFKVPQVQFITVVHASLFIQREVPAVCRSDSKGATGAIDSSRWFMHQFIQRQVPAVCVQTVEVSQVQFITVVHASLFTQRQVPAVCVQTVKVPQVQLVHHGGSCFSVHHSDKFQLSAFRQ